MQANTDMQKLRLRVSASETYRLFSSDLFDGAFTRKTHFRSILSMLERARCGLSFSADIVAKVRPMLYELAAATPGFYAVVRFMVILYELSQDHQAKVLSSESFARIRHVVDSVRINKVQDYVEEHYKDEIRLSTLADMVGMTEVSFSRFFKLRTGKSLSDYIIDIRLGHATRLLVDSTMAIAEICYECGFNNLSNFNRIFKKKKGCSPKEFREYYRKKRIVI